MTRRTAIGIAFAFGVPSFGAKTRLELESSKRVRVKRLPSRGIQPQAVVDSAGALHVVYYSDDPRHGNLFYIRSTYGDSSRKRSKEVERTLNAILDRASNALAGGDRVELRGF